MFNNTQGQRLRRATPFNHGKPALGLSQNRVGPKPTRQSRVDLRGQSGDLDMSWLNTRLGSPHDNSALDFDNLISVEDDMSDEYQNQLEQLSQTVMNHSKIINMLRMKLQQKETKLKEFEKVIQEMREFIKQSMNGMPPPEADPLDTTLSF